MINKYLGGGNPSEFYITTVAGVGMGYLVHFPGYVWNSFSGDGGPGIRAKLHGPTGLALDASRNVFFVDTYNQRVRKLDTSTGIIKTVAGSGTFGSWNLPGGNSGMMEIGYEGDGGLSTNAKMYDPDAIAIDASGNIFISDQANTRIRILKPNNDISGTYNISTLTGIEVNGIAVDASRNLYIATSDGYIKKIRLNRDFTINNSIEIAGKLWVDVSDDGRMMPSGYDPSPPYNVLNNNRARNVYLGTPRSIVVDPSGNVFFSDSYLHVIRKLTLNPDGTTYRITTIAGTGIHGYSGDNGLAINAHLNTPSGLALDSEGNLYISDTGNHRIRILYMSTGIIKTIAGNGLKDMYNNGVLPLNDGGPAINAGLSHPTGIALDRLGNVFFADRHNQRIRMLYPPRLSENRRAVISQEATTRRPATRPAPRPAPKPVSKPAPKPAPRPVPKPAPKPAPRPVPKPAPRPRAAPAPSPIPERSAETLGGKRRKTRKIKKYRS